MHPSWWSMTGRKLQNQYFRRVSIFLLIRNYNWTGMIGTLIWTGDGYMEQTTLLLEPHASRSSLSGKDTADCEIVDPWPVTTVARVISGRKLIFYCFALSNNPLRWSLTSCWGRQSLLVPINWEDDSESYLLFPHLMWDVTYACCSSIILLHASMSRRHQQRSFN